MCWETNACPPLTRQKVFFNSAPQASIGRVAAVASSSGSGAYPRDRRIGSRSPATTRTTESSVRMWIGRSWVRNASAMPASRASASSSR